MQISHSNSDKDGINPYLLLTLITFSATLCFGTIYLLHWLGLTLGIAITTAYASVMLVGLSVHKNYWYKIESDSVLRQQLLQRTTSALTSNISR